MIWEGSNRGANESMQRVRRIFWLDAGGAVLSVVLLGLVLPLFSTHLGVPPHIFRGLCCWALGCLVFDALWLWRMPCTPDAALRLIMAANTLYCGLTVVVMANHAALTPLGMAYVVGEFAVIAGLVALEWSMYRRLMPTTPPDNT